MPKDITVAGTVSVHDHDDNSIVFGTHTLGWLQEEFDYVIRETFLLNAATSPIAVALGNITTVRFIYVWADNELTLGLTPTAGVAESIPIRKVLIEDNFIALGGGGIGYTAMTLTRIAALDAEGEYIIAGD